MWHPTVPRKEPPGTAAADSQVRSLWKEQSIHNSAYRSYCIRYLFSCLCDVQRCGRFNLRRVAVCVKVVCACVCVCASCLSSSKIKYPKFLSSDAQNLLKSLLTRDPVKRMGSGSNGSDAIKRHPFFKSINWGKLDRREIESKFKPAVDDHRDTQNFDKLWTVSEECICPGPMLVLVLHSPFQPYA